MAPLSGKVALITGGSSGIGKAIAETFATAGATCVITGRNQQTLDECLTYFSHKSLKVKAIKADVTSEDDCLMMVAKTLEEHNKIDILVNNAGIIIREGIDSPKALQNLERMMDVNVLGTFIPTHAFLSALRTQRGCVINLSSIASQVGLPGTMGYSPSKGAVKLLTQALAVELAKDGIRVNAIAPGVIETPMTEFTRSEPEKLEKFMLRTPMSRVAQAEELIGPVVFLASEMSSYVTGITLVVDGGFLAA
jgi:NAD(P)-dependent dehydrogenase (short-subunit alcohol dehydrogenase family)